MSELVVELPTLHADQVRAYRLKDDIRAFDQTLPVAEREAWAANSGGRFKVIRCGRRWGKSKMGETWIGDGALKGFPCGWFAPDYKKQVEVFEELIEILKPAIVRSNKTEMVIRLVTGGRVDFWTLDNESAGRSRYYKRVFIDEGAFTKPNMLDIWKRSIKPTLFDLRGEAWVGSNTNGVAEDNFMYQICKDPQHGFIEYHAPTVNNPTIPKRLPGETEEEQARRRHEEIEAERKREHPLVFSQEYEAEFVDFSGVAFFDSDKWLTGSIVNTQGRLADGKPVPWPSNCDYVFAIVDSAAKSGLQHDGTAVIYFARNMYSGHPLIILDWDIVQIDGAMLEEWLPKTLQHLEDLGRQCGARGGSAGAHIEDKSTGTVLIQQAINKKMPVMAIDTKLTALGKDQRAINVSGYHFQGVCKISEQAYNKTTQFKGFTRNHLLSQVSNFRIGDPDAAKRADDLLDCYTYGLSLTFGNGKGF